jgi:hypothetical protein
MKKINIFCLLCLLVCGHVHSANLSQIFLKENATFYTAPKAGAASISELSNAILLALQTNNTEQLNGYLLTDAELKILKKQGSEDMTAILENQTGTDLKNTFQTDLKTLIQDGVAKTLNWTDMHLAETKMGQSTAKNRMLRPVELVLQAKNNQMVNLVFETIQLNNRYYLFRGIRFKS